MKNVCNIQIYDSMGRIIMQGLSTNGSSIQIEAADYAPGIYYIKILTEERLINQGRFIIE